MKVRNGLNATNACKKIRKITYIFHIFISYVTGIFLLLPYRLRSCQTHRSVRCQSRANPHFLTCLTYDNMTVCLLWTDTKYSECAMPHLKKHSRKNSSAGLNNFTFSHSVSLRSILTVSCHLIYLQHCYFL
jgi:hypothetical protein